MERKFFVAGPPVPASITVNSTTVVVTGEEESNWFGRPAVEVLADGTVVMVYKRGPSHSNDGSTEIHIRFSDDYGATWTDEDTDLDGDPVSGLPLTRPVAWGAADDLTEPWLYLAPNGDLLLHVWRYDWGDTSYGHHQCVSSDGGKTWGALAAITVSGHAEPECIYSTDDHFVYDGTIYAGCSFKESTIREGLISSPDNGASWAFVADVATGASEIGIEYVGSNTIIAMLRGSDNLVTWRSKSTDMGATWGTKEHYAYRIPASGRHRIWTEKHLKGEADWWTDPRLIMCGFVFTESGRRSCLWFSDDAGVNWSNPCYVDDVYEDGGYGDLFYNPITDEIVFMCYGGLTTKADIIQYNISANW